MTMRTSDRYVAPIDIMDVVGYPPSSGNHYESVREEIRDMDLCGMTFGRLHVERLVGLRGNKALYECRCECGNSVTIEAYGLLRRHTKSCGCLRKCSNPMKEEL